MKKITLSILFISCLSISAFGQGAYIEFKLTTSEGVPGIIKIYSRDSCTRTEINMSSPQMPNERGNQVTLILKDNPKKAYILDEKNKTYTGIDLSNTSAVEENPDQYDVTLVGKENANGYACTHVKLKKKSSSEIGVDLWVSTGIPSYEQFMSVKSKYTTAGIFKALAAKGALGFITKMIISGPGKTKQIDLIKAELRNNDPSLFSLAGYKEFVPPIAPEGAPDIQEIAKKIQNMSPEERQRFIEELKKKQQQKGSEITPASPH